MKVILKGHDETYAMSDIIKAFMPNEKIEYAENIPDGDFVYSEVSRDNGEFVYYTKFSYEKKVYENTLLKDTYDKTYVKMSFNEIGKEVFGIILPWGLLTGIRPSKIVRTRVENGQSEESVKDYFRNTYLVTEPKIDLVTKIAKKEQEIIKGMRKDAVSLYIGIPFCPTRCLYCSFVSQSLRHAKTLVEPYLECLKKEIEYTANIVGELGLGIETVYIGGGTPTTLTESQLDYLLNSLFESFDLSGLKEFSVEAGRPDTITYEKLDAIAKYPVDRLSINPQTMNEKTLRKIGRNHSEKDVYDSLELAEKCGFSNINMDLIAGLPDETAEDFSRTLDKICAINPKSVTVHTMCIKRSSYLSEKYDMYNITASNTVNAMLNDAISRMGALGKDPYYMYRQKNILGNLENIGFADKGYECLYNIYIMEEVQSILAMGVGASSKLILGDQTHKIYNVKEVYEYVTRIDEMLHRKDEIVDILGK